MKYAAHRLFFSGPFLFGMIAGCAGNSSESLMRRRALRVSAEESDAHLAVPIKGTPSIAPEPPSAAEARAPAIESNPPGQSKPFDGKHRQRADKSCASGKARGVGPGRGNSPTAAEEPSARYRPYKSGIHDQA